jgi:DUF4097 and DUF4098 domain-containing protein YvlB
MASLRTGRGDASLSGGAGDIRLIGEHGILSIENSTGQLSATTIMGTIRFLGQPDANDEIRLETDHGPVEVALAEESDLDLTVTTTSGSVTCTFPGLNARSSSGCTSPIGRGQGSLWIRTVSGTITIQRLHR